MILQGTTPTLTITVNPEELLLEDVTEIELTFQSGTQTPTMKSMSDLTIDTEANTLSYTFTETETLALSPSAMLIWQARFKLQSGVIVGTVKKSIKVIDLISEEVM
jgi:hypothetical protein